MSLGDQARELADAAADFRAEIFGIDQSGGAQMFRSPDSEALFACYFAPIRDRQQLEEANMNGIHDTVVRIKKSSGFVPRLGEVITLLKANNDGSDMVLRLDEFGHTAFNPEFVIGCANIL